MIILEEGLSLINESLHFTYVEAQKICNSILIFLWNNFNLFKSEYKVWMKCFVNWKIIKVNACVHCTLYTVQSTYTMYRLIFLYGVLLFNCSTVQYSTVYSVVLSVINEIKDFRQKSGKQCFVTDQFLLSHLFLDNPRL